MQKFLSFPVRPGMSGWVDCSDAYKRAWHEKFDPKPEEVVKEEKVMVNTEPIPEVEEGISPPEEIETWVKNPCPVCGDELPKGKKFCSRECFYNRNKS